MEDFYAKNTLKPVQSKAYWKIVQVQFKVPTTSNTKANQV
jgi:hypothetical protein